MWTWLGWAGFGGFVTVFALSPAILPARTDQRQQLTQANTLPFDIAPQSLASALNEFSRATDLQVSVAAEVVVDKSSPGVAGSLGPEQALRQLLLGTGLSYRFSDSDTVTLARATPQEDEQGRIELPAISVEGLRETAYGPVDGYVAGRSATGTKTDTPLIETPQSISVITRDRLDAQGVQRFDEALRYTPGVATESFGFDIRQSSIQLRGFSGANQNIYRDGLQLRNPGFGAFLTPEPYGAERIEVFRGPASVLYGQSAPGGLVNYVTKRPLPEPFREVEIEGGNFDRYAGKFDFSGPIDEDGVFSYRLTGLARDSDTQVDFVNDDRVYIAPAFTWRPSDDTSLTLLSHYQEYSTGDYQFFLPRVGTQLPSPFGEIPSNRFTGEPDFSGIDNDEHMIASSLEHRFNETFAFRQNARYYRFDYRSEAVFASELRADGRTFDRVTSAFDDELDGFAIDNQAEARFATGPLAHTLLLGVDFQHVEADILSRGGIGPPLDIFDPVYGSPVTPPTEITTDTEQTQEQLGLYLQDQIKLYDQWVVSLGGRYDWAEDELEDRLEATTTDQDDNEFTGRAGLLYLADNGLAPYFSYSESFLPIGGTNLAGEAFEPETGQQYEVGVKYQPPGSNSFITLAAFDLTRQNVTTPDPEIPDNQIQTGEVRSRGIELEGLASLDFGLDLIAAYTFLDAEIIESNVVNEAGERIEVGSRPSRVPEHLVSLWGDYTIQGGVLAGLGLGAGVRYRDSVFGDNENSVEVSDVTLVDAAVHYDWGNYRFALNANNLFDDEYFAGCTDTSCNYGAVRTVVGSVRYRW